jgi:beta-glucosidase/6-phospho-beta-glucosidase/beta-galactosidase
MYYTGDTDFCSSTCREEYPEKQKREQEERERQRKKEREEREKKEKYYNRKCDWCGKTYYRPDSTATNKGVYCSKRCEAKL